MPDLRDQPVAAAVPAESDPVKRWLDKHAPVDGWPLVLPMVVFLAFVWLGGQSETWGVWSYVGRTFIVGALLIWLWPRLRGDIVWTHLGLGVLVGVVGVVQWIGMDKLLYALPGWLGAEEGSTLARVIGWTSFADPDAAFIPTAYFENPAALWGYLAVRLLGPVLVVPVMEEVFWRNWLWRSLLAPADYRLAAVGERDWTAILGTSLAFALVHPQWLISIVWALLVAWLLVRTKSLGACIVAHAVTNLLLGLYVLVMTLGLGRESEWYFW